MTDLPNPLTPADCDLRDFSYMPLDVLRLRDSDLAARLTGEEFRCAVLLWCASWHQVPAGSLPDDDVNLAQYAGFGRMTGEWQKVKAGALWGWIKCADGRLYHPVVAEKANEAWVAKHKLAYDKLSERIRKRNKGRPENGLPFLELPEFEAWIDASRPLERVLFPSEFSTASGGKTKPSGGNSGSSGGSDASYGVIEGDFRRNDHQFPPENALKGTEGRGTEGRVNTVGSFIAPGKPARVADDDFRPKDAAEWLRHLHDKHGFEADPTNVNDRKRLWPVFAGWTNAGLTTAFVDDAIAAAIRDASEPIVCLPLYVDRCMANANAARASPNPSWTDQNAQTIAALTGRNRSHEPDDRTIDV